MPRNDTPKAKEFRDNEIHQDKPAKSLLRSGGKRMSQGNAAVIPVFVGGAWTLQVPRGNKRVLQLSVSVKAAKA